MTDQGTDDTDEQPGKPRPEDESSGDIDAPDSSPTALDDDTGTTDSDPLPGKIDSDDSTARQSDAREQRYSARGRSLKEYLELLAFAGLAVVTTVSTYGFYTNASRAISEFVSASYVSLFQAAFNLALLLIALAGLSLLARRRFEFAG